MEVSVQKKSKVLALALSLVVALMLLMGCAGSGNSNSSNGANAPEEISFDTPFEFDNLSISFGSGISTASIANQFSEHSGETAVALPITITNNSDETKGLNMFYYKAFDPSGAQLDDISSYFTDTDIAWAGDARSGASISSTMHILYTGPGDYYIEFDNYRDKIEVKLPINL